MPVVMCDVDIIISIAGAYNFIQYFYNDLQTLPKTCRCEKVCNHVIFYYPLDFFWFIDEFYPGVRSEL